MFQIKAAISLFISQTPAARGAFREDEVLVHARARSVGTVLRTVPDGNVHVRFQDRRELYVPHQALCSNSMNTLQCAEDGELDRRTVRMLQAYLNSQASIKAMGAETKVDGKFETDTIRNLQIFLCFQQAESTIGSPSLEPNGLCELSTLRLLQSFLSGQPTNIGRSNLCLHAGDLGNIIRRQSKRVKVSRSTVC